MLSIFEQVRRGKKSVQMQLKEMACPFLFFFSLVSFVWHKVLPRHCRGDSRVTPFLVRWYQEGVDEGSECSRQLSMMVLSREWIMTEDVGTGEIEQEEAGRREEGP